MTGSAHGPEGHSAAPVPTPSPKPVSPKGNKNHAPPGDKNNSHPTHVPSPKLRLRANDLTHPSSKTFLTLFPDLNSVLKTALSVIVAQLYTSPQEQPSHSAPIPVRFQPCIPPTRSVTVIVRDFSGVAHTNGIELDNDHKEIHLSLSYVTAANKSPSPSKELTGVLQHELVHCYQHTTPPRHPGRPNPPHPPSGLVEGVADFVRLKAGLSPPHWKRPTSAGDRPDRWDAGYQSTAYFLEWIEDVKVGKGAVGMLNDRLRTVGYVGEGEKAQKEKGGNAGFWVGLFGLEVLQLWEEYGKYLDGLKGKGKK